MKKYDTLGMAVDENTTFEDIKSQYRKRSMELHPDKGGSDDLMVRLTEERSAAMKECFKLKHRDDFMETNIAARAAVEGIIDGLIDRIPDVFFEKVVAKRVPRFFAGFINAKAIKQGLKNNEFKKKAIGYINASDILFWIEQKINKELK